MGGTRVATGLEMARVALRRAGLRHGAILLVSDLDDSNSDQPSLEQEASTLRAQHIPLRIVPLFATTRDVARFTALFGAGSLVDPSVFTHTAKRHAASVAAAQPWALLLLGAALVLLLAGNERWNGRL
jgi:predicted phage tail protein